MENRRAILRKAGLLTVFSIVAAVAGFPASSQAGGRKNKASLGQKEPIELSLDQFRAENEQAFHALEGSGLYFQLSGTKDPSVLYLKVGDKVFKFPAVSGDNKNSARYDKKNSSPIPPGDYGVALRDQAYKGDFAFVIVGTQYYGKFGFAFDRYDFLIHRERLGKVITSLIEWFVKDKHNTGCISPDRDYYDAFKRHMNSLISEFSQQDKTTPSSIFSAGNDRVRIAPWYGKNEPTGGVRSAYEHALAVERDSPKPNLNYPHAVIPLIVRPKPIAAKSAHL